MTEWLGNYWTAFCDSFRQKQEARAQEGTTQNCKGNGIWLLKLRVLLTFSVYISCLYSGFITAAQLSRPTRQRLAYVVCTPQQTLRVLFTRSTWLSRTVTRCGLRSYSSSSKSTTTLSIFFRNTTSLHPPQQLHSTINSDSVHSPHCRVQMFDPATSLTRILLLLFVTPIIT